MTVVLPSPSVSFNSGSRIAFSDDARPWVILTPQNEGHDRKMHQDRRGQDDADHLGSYRGGGINRVGRDRRQGELGMRQRPLLLWRR